MKLLADENVEPAVVSALRALGHDVLAIGASLRSKSEKAVLGSARRAKRIVLVRLPRWSSARKARRVAEAISQVGSRIDASLVVIEEVAVRCRWFTNGN